MKLNITSEGQITVASEDMDQLRQMNLGKLQVKVSHILVPTVNKAQEIYDIITASGNTKDTFAQQATKESSCPSKKNGGDLGWFEKGQMVPEFDRAAFEMKVGEIRTGVVTQFGTHILFKEDEQLLLPVKTH